MAKSSRRNGRATITMAEASVAMVIMAVAKTVETNVIMGLLLLFHSRQPKIGPLFGTGVGVRILHRSVVNLVLYVGIIVMHIFGTRHRSRQS